MRRLLVVLLAASFGFGCGEEDEAPPPMAPVLQSPSAVCASVEQVWLLDQVQLRVKDLDGTEDLLDPLILVEGTAPLPIETEVLPWNEDAARAQAEASGEKVEKCRSDLEPPSCEVIYRWERDPLDPEAQRIFCGESGDGLSVHVEQADTFGFRKTGIVPSRPE